MPITHVGRYRAATMAQRAAAIRWTADNLHVPVHEVPGILAVAYVERHFESGRLQGWDGFLMDVES